MQGGETEALNKNKLDTISCNDNNTQAPRQQPQDLASSGATNTTSSPPLPSGEPSPALHHLSNMALTDHQLLLALQQRNQMDNQSILRSQGSNSMDRESLMALAGQTPGAFGLGEGGGAMNDRVLLQLLNEQRQQELQRQALARELAERDYERSLLQRLGAIGGNPAALGLGSLGGLGLDPLGRSQGSAFEQARLSALLGGQLPGQIPSPLLQALNGLPQGGALGGTSLNRGPPGGTTVGFDDSITLEARSKQAFPLKLYRMLERAERNGQDDIISFIDDGKAFAIHKPRAFETDIMPSYFNSHRMSSFQRQLNIYVSLYVLMSFDKHFCYTDFVLFTYSTGIRKD